MEQSECTTRELQRRWEPLCLTEPPERLSDQSRPDQGQAVPLKLSRTHKSPGGAADYQILIQKVWGQDTCSKLPKRADSTGVG